MADIIMKYNIIAAYEEIYDVRILIIRYSLQILLYTYYMKITVLLERVSHVRFHPHRIFEYVLNKLRPIYIYNICKL